MFFHTIPGGPKKSRYNQGQPGPKNDAPPKNIFPDSGTPREKNSKMFRSFASVPYHTPAVCNQAYRSFAEASAAGDQYAGYCHGPNRWWG